MPEYLTHLIKFRRSVGSSHPQVRGCLTSPLFPLLVGEEDLSGKFSLSHSALLLIIQLKL